MKKKHIVTFKLAHNQIMLNSVLFVILLLNRSMLLLSEQESCFRGRVNPAIITRVYGGLDSNN